MEFGPWGRREIEPASAPGSDTALREAQLTCEQCGAVLSYAPGRNSLQCDYCGHVNAIEIVPVRIVEQDLEAALQKDRHAAPLEEIRSVRCSSCQATFTFDPDRHAGECPFCGQSIVTDTSAHHQIKPQAVLPFEIAEETARGRVRTWLRSLWFAPGRLKRMGQVSGALHGVYLPYWTYDSDTETDYVGRRGEIYLEPVQVRTRVNGRDVVQTKMVQKVRWYPARGRVRRHFDDVLVLASNSLPTWMTDRLEPWDLGGLKPYSAVYLTGFQAEAYRIGLGDGFNVAHDKMKSRIASDVRMDIGGDLQRIEHMDIRHREPTFKHVLLPLWLGAFRYSGKTYHVSVNGQNGEVQGERPYSAWKIFLLVLFIAAIGAAIAYYVYLNQPPGGF